VIFTSKASQLKEGTFSKVVKRKICENDKNDI